MVDVAAEARQGYETHESPMQRPQLNMAAAARAMCAVALALVSARLTLAEPVQGWEALDAILDQIKPPNFPDRTASIVDFGAKPDGGQDSRAAIQQAIDQCSKDGGGRVVVPH